MFALNVVRVPVETVAQQGAVRQQYRYTFIQMLLEGLERVNFTVEGIPVVRTLIIGECVYG